MTIRYLICLAWLAAMGVAHADVPPARDAGAARALTHQAIDAMGGMQALHNVRQVELAIQEYHRMLAQSERPQGPWIPQFSRTRQWTDFTRGRVRTDVEATQWGAPSISVVDGDVAARQVAGADGKPRVVADGRRALWEAQWRLALGPERVLLTALEAPDLHLGAQVTLQDVPQKVLAFTWKRWSVRVFLNTWTLLPTAVQVTRAHPDDVFWNPWGDVTTRIYYSFWTLQPGGLRYPKQWDIRCNDMPWRTLFVDSLDLHPQPPADPVQVTDELRTAFQRRDSVDDVPLGRPDHPAVTLAPGVIMIPGAWNVTLVRQSDGIVILEAPISAGYSDKVLAEVQRRFPGVPVKAVVSTSNAWPHVGGVRGYVAKHLPIYVLDLNVSLLDDIVQAPHHLHPDALARQPQAPRWKAVSRKTVIGDGANRIELYPVHGEAGERMMLAWMPAQRLLYASDLVQPAGKGTFAFPEYLVEVANVVAREKLPVERVFAMHTPQPLPWSTVTKAIAHVVSPSP